MKILLLLLSTLYANLPYHESAVCYGPFRDGQAPGETNPSKEELRQDLHIIAQEWSSIRMYGSRGSTETVLEIISNENIDLKLYLGVWIASEFEDSSSTNENEKELNQAIYLSNKYPQIVEAVIIGNETQVFWTSNKVNFDTLKKYIRFVKSKIQQPITTADDFNFWNKPKGLELAKEIDFIMIHIHPHWAGTVLQEAVPFVERIYQEISILYPQKQLVIGETGWSTSVHSIGQQAELIKGKAGIFEQYYYYKSINKWSKEKSIQTFIFEAFDEKWKGGDHPNEVEKHWGLFNSNRTPKHNLNNE